MRVVGGTLHLSLRTSDRDIAVHADLTESQVETLGWWHACQNDHHERSGNAVSRDLWRELVGAAGEAVEAMVVDISGAEPVFRVRTDDAVSGHGVVVTPVDAVMLLSVAHPPVEVVTPCPPEDWDAALAKLLAGNA